MMNFYLIVRDSIYFIYFFFNDTATTEIYTLSLHDALPICEGAARHGRHGRGVPRVRPRATGARGDQDAPARGARRRRRGARALQAGDPPGAQDRPPQRGADVRPGRSERAVLSHDVVRGGHVAQAADLHSRPVL